MVSINLVQKGKKIALLCEWSRSLSQFCETEINMFKPEVKFYKLERFYANFGHLCTQNA